MKEMLGDLADGQIEFYKAVSLCLFPIQTAIFTLMLRAPGHGGMGTDYPHYRSDTRGRLNRFIEPTWI